MAKTRRRTTKRLKYSNRDKISGTQFIFDGRKRRGAGLLSNVVNRLKGHAASVFSRKTARKLLQNAKVQLKKKSTQKLIAKTASNVIDGLINDNTKKSNAKTVNKRVKKKTERARNLSRYQTIDEL